MTIHPTYTDIGRKVIYRANGGTLVEEGEITKITSEYVFVRYSGDGFSKATLRQSLTWSHNIAPPAAGPESDNA